MKAMNPQHNPVALGEFIPTISRGLIFLICRRTDAYHMGRLEDSVKEGTQYILYHQWPIAGVQEGLVFLSSFLSFFFIIETA